MRKQQPSTEDKVINLTDVRKRIEAEAKSTGKKPSDIFTELFGDGFGAASLPQKTAAEMYAEALQPLVEALNRFADNQGLLADCVGKMADTQAKLADCAERMAENQNVFSDNQKAFSDCLDQLMDERE